MSNVEFEKVVTMPTERRRTKVQQREATVHKLLQISRALFTEYGYAQTSTEAIVERASVTRGALYHYFGNKEGLFKAVLNEVQHDVAQRIEAATQQSSDPWAQFVAGCHAFLAASLEPDVQRIMLIDAPAVLGWDTWRQMDAEYSMKALHEGLSELATRNMIQPLPIDALVHILSGAMNEAALWIARADQPQQALTDATITLEQLLQALHATEGR
jgi:AcrR family transcriptional regulator